MLPINLQVLVIMSDFLIFGRFRSKREEHSTNHTTEISRSKLFQMLFTHDVEYDVATHLVTQLLSRSERASMR